MENPEEYRNKTPAPVRDTKETKAQTIVMQIELILKLIACKMPAEDLIYLRETCSIWNKTFLPPLREQQEIKTCSPVSIQKWTDLMRSAEDTPTFPTAKYRLNDLHKLRPQMVTNFFGMCGHIITHLDMKYSVGAPWWERCIGSDRPLNLDQLRWIIFEQTPNPNLVDLRLGISKHHTAPQPISDKTRAALMLPRDLPNLRRLEIYVARDHRTLHQGYSNLLAELLQHATGLECLSLGSAYGIKNVDVMSAIADRSLPNPCLSNLSRLEIYNLQIPELEILCSLATHSRNTQNRLQVTTLLTSIVYLHEILELEHLMELLVRFLDSQSSTLRHLGIKLLHGTNFYITERNIPVETKIDLPQLPAVHTFHLDVSGWEQEAEAGPQPEPRDPDELAKAKLFTQPLELIFPGLIRFEYVNTFVVRLEESRLHIEDDMTGFGHAGVTHLSLNTNYVRGSGDNDSRAVLATSYGLRFQLQQLTRLEITLRPCQVSSILSGICDSMSALEVLHVICEGDEFRTRESHPFKLTPSVVGLQPTKRLLVAGSGTRSGPPTTATTTTIINLDSVLTGIPAPKLGELRRRVIDIDTQGGSSRGLGQLTHSGLGGLLEEYKTGPGLQELRSLKKFVLEMCGVRFRLTDIGGYFGLAMGSPQLQHIAVEGFELGKDGLSKQKKMCRESKQPPREETENSISKQCERTIRKSVGHTLVISF